VRVGLDLQLARGTATGIGEYASGLFEALRELGIDAVALRSERFDPWRFDRRAIWDQALLPLAARRARVDLLHCTSGTMPLFAPVPTIVTVHDVAWLRVQSHARGYARAYFGAFSLERYRSARRILVDSAFSRDELRAVAPAIDPRSIDVVYPGVSSDFAGVVRVRDDLLPFALVTGTVERRKNFETLVRALPAVLGLRLVSVGPPTPYRDECLRLARELGVLDRVDVRGYVPRAELLSLYARAAFAAVPSRYEGFGYAVAQALCAGLPLISSDAASLPELLPDARSSLDPGDVPAWSDAMRAMLAGRDAADARATELRPASIARFAWGECARLVAAAYAKALVD
jgi:glycosyltransferase involved in cell wall biosynthesis